MAWLQGGNVPLNIGPTPTVSPTPTLTPTPTSTAATPTPTGVTPTIQVTPTATGATATPTAVATPLLLVRGKDARTCLPFCVNSLFANNTYYAVPGDAATINRGYFSLPTLFQGYFKNLICRTVEKDSPTGSRHTATIETAACTFGTTDGAAQSCTWTPVLRMAAIGTKNITENGGDGVPARTGVIARGTQWQFVFNDVNAAGAMACCVEYCPEP
jgi:hypothetical protein